MTLYAIRDWHKLFENNRTRELKRLDWVPLPNKQDGDGFTDLIGREAGIALFGTWVLILQLASKCTPRGTLCRQLPASNGAISTTPHTAATISRITRCPIELVEKTLLVCIEIGWIEHTEYDPAAGCEIVPGIPQGIPQDDAPRVRARNGTEENGTEENGTLPNPLAGELESIAQAIHTNHPPLRRDIGVGSVRKHLVAILRFKKLASHKSEPAAIQYLRALRDRHERTTNSWQWQKNSGEFAKGLNNYLAVRECRYEEEPPADPGPRPIDRRPVAKNHGIFRELEEKWANGGG